MKKWTTKSSTFYSGKKREILEDFKSEILDTRIVVSNIFSNYRTQRDLKSFQSRDFKTVTTRQK
jgi:hypothetical protein